MAPEEIAAVTHDANRRLQLLQDDPAPSPAWEHAPKWQRDSAVDGVRGILDGNTPEESHQNWCNYKIKDGWVWGSEKNEVRKTHPCLVPYAELPAEQRLKDTLFHAIVNALASDS